MRELTAIPPAILDTLVGGYIKNVKFTDKDGTIKEYEPDSLTSIHRGIDRYLRENEYGYSLVTSEEFKTSKAVLEARRAELKSKGKGNRPNQAEPITPEEEDLLWDRGALGNADPIVLQNTIYYLNAKYLGFRASDESRQLEWGDIVTKMDADGSEYLEWNERKTKTRNGQPRKLRPFQPKVFENQENPERCLITLLKEFAQHRNDTSDEHSPFYVAVKHNKTPEDNIWYKRQPMGEKTLGKIVKTICLAGGLPGKKTNHSVRKTMITNLLHAGVNPLLIQQLSGHKNVNSINNYGVASKAQQKTMCHILQN